MRSLLFLSPLFALFLVAGCGNESEEVNVYSARKEALIKPLLERFTEQTGVKVNLITGNADALVERIKAEGEHSPADLLLTTDAGRLYRADQAALLASTDNAVLEDAVPAELRDPQGRWFGLSVRARVIVYAPDRVESAQLSSYEGLADPRWRGRLCVRSSDNIYNQSLVASLIAHDGAEATETWARGLVANLARNPVGGDRDQIKAVVAGECDLALVNTYYLAMMQADPQSQETASRVAVFWPNQDGRGTHINISGAGVTRDAPNRDHAVRLLEFLVSDEAQRWYADANHEYPVRATVPASDRLSSWGDFKADTLPLVKLGELNGEAVRVMDRAGWR
ncbi:Fe(3+) ABC transporter substrate-binding protein (plasmid) [Alcanivorax sp. N3-2A]|nr:Fe(3+) ABC transporter substrate-binding protein [Alcanivorax sp. N3-2A]ASK36825.1 Fe(3+) ABC transporter substrate-binding protein [Alcanivorax sp. N3-2A]|tara:strand:- start:4677 stop:5690 length:1014 start_codon:yes stop_codon:yes gene_type:complete